MRGTYSIAAVALALAVAGPASATVTISTKPTQNMSCVSGVCAPTAKKAVLNVNDLTGMLETGDVTVKSDRLTKDIVVGATVSWANTQKLALNSYQSIAFDNPVVVTGSGGLAITTNTGGGGGELNFVKKGHVEFWDTTSNLTINGKSFVLVSNIAALAADVATNQAGNYALSKDYDAKQDGKYKQTPVTWGLQGTFEGLGNRIENLSIKAKPFHSAGLFSYIDHGSVRDLGLEHVSILGADTSGALASDSSGTIENCYVTGSISSNNGPVGGLVGEETGTISHSYSSASVNGASNTFVGGLVGFLNGEVVNSHASGAVSGGDLSDIGGLLGFYNGNILRSYATGPVAGGSKALIGGLIGNNSGNVTQSYATGSVFGLTDSKVGGLIGALGNGGSESFSTGHVSGDVDVGGLVGSATGTGNLSNMYWDLDTSGISDPSKGAGDIPNDPGITGLTTSQFKSELPAGFDPSVWGQKPSINGGYPYLIANPPPQ